MWDSGQVKSAQSVDVPYGGPALRSGQRYHWRVRVWDTKGKASAWSTTASFETGLKAQDWTAQWIGSPATTPSLTDTHWIWYPEGDPASSAPAATRYLRRTVDLGAGAITSGQFTLTADDEFTLYVNGTKIASSPEVTDGWKQGRLEDVTSALRPGANTIAIQATNTTESPAGVIGRLHVERSGAGPVDVVTDTAFKTAQTAPDGWEQPGFDDSSWPAAKDLGVYGSGPWASQVAQPSPPVPYLRHGFQLGKPVASARLYVSALGLYEAHINGQRVGDDDFTPGWTDYNKRVQYQTYDVTSMLHQGDNAIGALLGDGWYSGNIGFAGTHVYGKQPWFLGQLQVDFTDGTSQTVGTDDSWKTAASPLSGLRHLHGRDLRRQGRAVRMGRHRLRRPGLAGGHGQHGRAAEPRRAGRPAGTRRHGAPSGRPDRAQARSVRLRPRPEHGRLEPPEGLRHGRHHGDTAQRRGAQPRRHDLHRQHARRGRHRPLHAQGRRHRDVRAALHLPRLPLRRGDRLPGHAGARTPSRAWSPTPTPPPPGP